MATLHPSTEQVPKRKHIHWTIWCLLGVGAVLFVYDHWTHTLGVLPYLLVLACPLIHIFMHRGHNRHIRGDDKGGKV